MSTADIRPPFLERLSDGYNFRRKNIILLTGDVHGIFCSSRSKLYLSLEQVLNAELRDKFLVATMNIASGIAFFDSETETEITRICESIDGYYTPAGRIAALKKMVEASRHSPLSALVLLQGMAEAFVRVRRLEPGIKPLCLVVQFAGSLFPAGDYPNLSEIERQCLVSFLDWVTEPAFRDSPELIILINPVKSEINAKVSALPNTAHFEIDLPARPDRMDFIECFRAEHPEIDFSQGIDRFAEDTAGLSLNQIKDLMESASRRKTPITKQHVTDEVNIILQAQLGDIIRIKYPDHTSADIVGYKETREIFTSVFERCDDPQTAVSAILVSGPNGGGKTYQLEAYAAESGRVVVELAAIRGSYFGETERFFELLRWHIGTFGKILILVDEAHTAFGSVHSGQTHETEQRLSGNIIKMMGDPRYLGKVLWALMTSRPDELDPDIKSRASVQIPVFDLEGDERREFVLELFRRKGIDLTKPELTELLEKTDYYSARDFRNLTAEMLAQKKKKSCVTIIEVLSGWQASKSIKRQREFQEIIAAMHCSYPNLLPRRFREASDEALQKTYDQLKYLFTR